MPAEAASPRWVTSADGTRLAVYESGDRSGPPLLAVHGYPDDHRVWDGVAAALADRFHVITYDVRGAGASDKPRAVGAYRLPQLVTDLRSVLDAVRPDTPVTLVGHDWGSIQGWAALTDPELGGRVASYTSISGPSLDHASVWLRRWRAHPRAALRQLAHSYYVLLFQAPVLPEAAIRAGVLERALARTAPAVPRSTDDAVRGLKLYRANMRHAAALGASARPPRITIPVQVIAPRNDPFVTVDLAVQAPQTWVEHLSTHVVAGGHWIVSDQPAIIAELIANMPGSAPTR